MYDIEPPYIPSLIEVINKLDQRVSDLESDRANLTCAVAILSELFRRTDFELRTGVATLPVPISAVGGYSLSLDVKENHEIPNNVSIHNGKKHIRIDFLAR